MNRYLRTTLKNYAALSQRFVQIDDDRLIAHVKAHAAREFVLPRWDVKGVHPENNLAFPSHCFWHNTMNFCFSHPKTTSNGKILRFRIRDIHGVQRIGSYAMGACFYRQFGERPILAEDMLPHVESLSKVKSFFKGAVSIPLISERWDLLTEAVCRLEEHFGGDPLNIFEAGHFRAFGEPERPGIVDLLIKLFPETFGSDKAILEQETAKPLEFHFYKRAQLFVLEYHGRAFQSGTTLKPIADVEEVGPIADYGLPKAFHSERILAYSQELQEDIERLRPIASGSGKDIEIRASLSSVFTRWLKLVNFFRKGMSLPPIHIGHADHFWWEAARQAQENHHLCLTTNY